MSNTEATTVKMPHIQLDASIHTTAAILPGDPARVDAIAAFLTDVREEGFNREYKSITGTYKGRRILAISTGMGGPSTAICVEELADLGVTDLIRIGSCGALQRDLRLGQLVICDRAVCDDGTSQTLIHLPTQPRSLHIFGNRTITALLLQTQTLSPQMSISRQGSARTPSAVHLLIRRSPTPALRWPKSSGFPMQSVRPAAMMHSI